MHCAGCTATFPAEAKEAFSDAQIASAVPSAAFDAFAQCRLRLMEVRLSSEMERQKDAEVQRELQRLMQMDEQQRRVHAKAREVCELLTDACPRCKQAFLDFNGCCALTCSRCPCGFCAWCLQVCIIVSGLLPFLLLPSSSSFLFSSRLG